MTERRVVIMGAAGRDFHNFNTVYRDNADVKVVAFTAAQIPGIESRRYPPELAGPRYAEGIKIVPEEDLEDLVRREDVDEVVFAYSDVSHEYVMHQASRALAAGADFTLLGTDATMVKADVPVISVCSTRTGAGKSQTSRFLADVLIERGLRPVVIRHPMPYGDLAQQRVQRFANLDDLDQHHTTVEEREDYEPHLRRGLVVYAGVDYEAILREAEKEVDIVLWDGGNNDFSFYATDLLIVVADPLRPGHEVNYYPGETNVRMADVFVINKVDTANPDDVIAVRESLFAVNPTAQVLEAASPIYVDDPDAIRGKRVLVVEDGPTLTHGGMATGAGVQAAREHGAAEIVDPRPYAVGELASVYQKYSHLGPILPAVGYFPEQLRDLEATIAAVPADVAVIATPFDVRRVIQVDKPMVRVTYELEETGEPSLTTIVDEFLVGQKLRV